MVLFAQFFYNAGSGMNKLQIILCMSLLTAFIGGCDSANENTGELNNNIQVIDKVSDSEPVSNTSSSVTESLPEVKDNPKKSIIKEKSAVFNLAEVEETYAGIKFKVSDISERSYGNGNALAVTFNVPLNPTQKFSQYLRVQRGDSFVDGDWILSESGKVAYFENIEPSSKYMLEVDRKIPSALGDRLHRTSSASIATRAMKPSITFASTGSFLPIDANVGLPITTLNVPEINIDFHRIKSKNVIYVLREMNNTQNHRNYSIESVRKYGELAHSGRYEFSAKKNKRKNINIPLNDKKILNDPGLYVAVMTVPGSYESRIQATYFMVTDLGVHIRRYAQQTDIYINSLKTANPIKGVSIELLNNNGQRISDYTTNSYGQVSYKNRSDAHYLVASNNNSYSIITLKKSALDLSTFDLGIRPFKSHEVFIYTDRDLYRPGDNINFNAILRDFDGKKVRDTRISAKIKQANGQVVKNISWDSKGDGYYSYDYKIRSDAQVGSWTFEVSGIDDETVIYPFKVEEFLPERLKITFNENSEIDQTFTPRENVKIPVLGEYLYGAPAAGNRFDASISVKLQRHPFKDYKDFYFGNEEETQWNKNIKEKNKITDSEGKLLIEVPTRWQNTKSPLSVTIFGSLYETGGRPISRKHIATVLPDNGLIGIRPLFKENASVNDKAMFEIIKTNSKGEKLAVKDLDIILINEDRQYFWEYNNHRGWHYTNTEKEYSVLTISSDIEKDKTSIVGLPVVYGSYRVEILDKDTGYKTTYKFRAGHDWYYSWKKSQNKESAARPDKITLALDKEFYKAGEVAKLTMIPPSAGEALIIVEANSPLWSKRISLPKEGITVDIPVDKNWSRHDIYISVVNIRPANHDKKITPTRSFGLLHLPLNRENKKIDITIQAPEKWTPNQKVNVTLNVDNTNNKKTWITLSAVDVGILNITDYKTPDPHKFFFEPRRYQVDALDMYNRLIDLNDNDLAKLKFGGDAGDISHGGKQAKSEVQIVSLFSGLVEVKNGIATVELELPDFNGRLRMMAVAFNDDSVGSSEKEVTVAAPLVTQLSMPRFVAMGDQSTLALDLNNLSGNDVNINVKLSVNGAIIIEEKVETLTLLDKQMKTLHYPFDVGFKDVPSIISLNVSGIEN
jgi:uncharacterized protein YfaS (alpha-2-macroglobulin family)